MRSFEPSDGLEIYWIAADRSGRKTYDRRTYIYCPGKIMVSQVQH